MVSSAARTFLQGFEANSTPAPSLAEERADWEAEAAAEPLPENTKVEPCTMGGIAGEWITCGSFAERGVLLHLHGGGYRAGSLVTHRGFAARLSRATGLRVLLIDYRLAPEHPYPAALEDARAAFGALIASGVDAGEIVLVGDSAGGGLAITLMLALKLEGARQPAGAVLMSPWTDLECRGESYQTNIPTDPLMSRDDLLSAAADYRSGRPATDPMLSPIHADLAGLPRMLIQAGSGEIMLDDAVAFAGRAQEADVEATLDITQGVWHVFQTAPEDIPEVSAALTMIEEFVSSMMKDNPAQ